MRPGPGLGLGTDMQAKVALDCVGRPAGVGFGMEEVVDTRTRVEVGFCSKTDPLVEAALIATGTCSPVSECTPVWLFSVELVLSTSATLASGSSVNFIKGTSGFLTITGESLKGCWETVHCEPDSKLRGEAGGEETVVEGSLWGCVTVVV